MLGESLPKTGRSIEELFQEFKDVVRIITAALSMLALLIFVGCSSTGSYPPPGLRKPPQKFNPGDIVDTRSAKIIPFEELVDDLSKVRVIYVGEIHVSLEDHRVQQQILEALHDRNPSLILAMEMFPREVQPVLNQWSAGVIDKKTLLEEVRWEKTWGYPFRLYEKLLTWAQDNGMKVLALNAPSKIVRRIARNGFSSLTPEERAQIAQNIDLHHPRHREYVQGQYERHLKGAIRDFESFYEAQLAWEETMAETLAQELSSSRGGEQILVIIGSGHIRYRWGVPQRVQRRFQHFYRTVVPMPARFLTEGIDPEFADYVWVTEGKEFSHPPRGRIGIVIRPLSSGEGLEVLGVIPNSPAGNAGIKKGDVIYKVNDSLIRTPEDLHKAVAKEKSKSIHQFWIKRDPEEFSVEILMEKQPGENHDRN
jgi:uncharacterized iron-regulated protein